MASSVTTNEKRLMKDVAGSARQCYVNRVTTQSFLYEAYIIKNPFISEFILLQQTLIFLHIPINLIS